MAVITLTARPDAFAFSAHEEQVLRSALADVDRNTVITPIGSVQDVLLNADTGQTLSGYNYSDVSLAQICSLIAPGLIQLVLDVCGQWRRPGEDKQFFSGAHAVDVFNRLVKLRFERKLSGMQFIRDTKKKIIDGVVSARYRYLSNGDFFDRVAQQYANSGVKFLEACLYGRELAVRYLFNDVPNIRFTCCGDIFIPGYHFANSEVGGRSVRTASLLVQKDTGYCALGPYREGSGGRVVHSGRSFERRLHALLSTMLDRLPIPRIIEDGARLLDHRSLHLGGEVQDRNTRQLVTVLRRRKLNLGFAKRVVSSAVAMGRGNSDALLDRMPEERRLVLEARTGYDLFAALIREARALPLDQREIAEQVAYALLSGKISI